jgi:hypothetical protein
MKMIKIALLASAALAAVSMSARADDLSDLKARIAALEANAATTSVPAGFSLLTVSQADAIVVPGFAADVNYGKKATQIGIMPTADMPASTVIQWSGYVKAALVYNNYKFTSTTVTTSHDGTYADVQVKSGMKVVGTTDTAVGEVGVKLAFQANWASGANDKNVSATVAGPSSHLFAGQATVTTDGVWGWWKMTPQLTLAGGYDGSLSGIGYGYDGKCSCNFTDNAFAGYGAGDITQMRLSYADGPLAAAIALEDWTNNSNGTANGAASDFGVAGELKYSGDTISGEIAGDYRMTTGAAEAAWIVGAGVGFALGDMANISMSAGMGSSSGLNDDYWKANVLASLNLSDTAHAELGFNHHVEDNAFAFDKTTNAGTLTQNAVLAGVYWSPASQLTIGLEGEWIDNSYTVAGYDFTRTTADLVTIFKF